MSEVRVVNDKTGGMKGAKTEDFSLLPWDQLAEVARLYAFGADKYERHNWRKGYDWHLSFASMMRHAVAWWEGEFDDAESGCDHMASVVFHALSLMYFREHHADLDTRACADASMSVGLRNENSPFDSTGLRFDTVSDALARSDTQHA